MVSNDLRVKGVSRRKAAERLGVKPSVVSIQLSGKKYFGARTALKYSEEFGYNYTFLKTGLGYLNANPERDSWIVASAGPSARSRSVAGKYMKNKALQEKIEVLQKSVSTLEKERDRALKALETEKLRNEKLSIRIERLMDKMEQTGAL